MKAASGPTGQGQRRGAAEGGIGTGKIVIRDAEAEGWIQEEEVKLMLQGECELPVLHMTKAASKDDAWQGELEP